MRRIATSFEPVLRASAVLVLLALPLRATQDPAGASGVGSSASPTSTPPPAATSTQAAATTSSTSPARAAAVSPAQTPAQSPPPAPSTVTPSATVATPPSATAAALPPVPEMRYHAISEVAAWAQGWIQNGAASAVTLPPSRGGLRPPALEFGAAGPRPLAERPTIFLFGALDGHSRSGAEAVLRICDDLLRQRAALPPDVAFVGVPWCAPDGLVRAASGESNEGRDTTPFDDDGDLAVDEDGPDDVDGDGQVLEMLVEDPDGPWARCTDPRFLAPARPGDRPRYRRSREGRDDDGDGRYNEDPKGGVVLDRSFPVGWSEGSENPLGGTLPLDDDLSRALADLMLARPPLACLVFQGNHGGLARTPFAANLAAPAGPDLAPFAAVAQLFADATGRPLAPVVSLAEAHGAPAPGAAIDWIHATLGALAIEVAAWGPEVERPEGSGPVAVQEARFDERTPESRAAGAAPEVSKLDRQWARWLDDQRGGIGFVDWHPVDLSAGKQALVGGWLPLSREDAPVESLPAAMRGLSAFVAKLARAAPVLEARVLDAHREGDVVTLRVRIENKGLLPTGLSTTRDAVGPTSVRYAVQLPTGARLLWGEGEARLPHLGPGESSREIQTVVLLPTGSALKLRASAPWSAPLEREVQP